MTTSLRSSTVSQVRSTRTDNRTISASITAAVIQPYFIPYAGYFRLFAAADVVVMFDCVQFPRRGWMHRNRLPLASGETDWFTLPTMKADRDARIDEIALAPDAAVRLKSAAHRFPLLERAVRDEDPLVQSVLEPGSDNAATYIIALLEAITARLGIERRVVRSSSLAIPAELHAQDRVISIVQRVGASRYVNPSGGRDLYDHASFAAAGLELGFLSPYTSSFDSILSRLLSEPASSITDEIQRETVVQP